MRSVKVPVDNVAASVCPSYLVTMSQKQLSYSADGEILHTKKPTWGKLPLPGRDPRYRHGVNGIVADLKVTWDELPRESRRTI